MLIEDFGEGIAPDVLPHVFEPFFRGDESRDRKSGGTGLGLAICKAICEKAGGTIEISSTSGTGTRVTVQLPIAHAEIDRISAFDARASTFHPTYKVQHLY